MPRANHGFGGDGGGVGAGAEAAIIGMPLAGRLAGDDAGAVRVDCEMVEDFLGADRVAGWQLVVGEDGLGDPAEAGLARPHRQFEGRASGDGDRSPDAERRKIIGGCHIGGSGIRIVRIAGVGGTGGGQQRFGIPLWRLRDRSLAGGGSMGQRHVLPVAVHCENSNGRQRNGRGGSQGHAPTTEIYQEKPAALVRLARGVENGRPLRR